jgi:PadR family transcriptional regulator PadR
MTTSSPTPQEDYIENIQSQMRKGFLEFCIILILRDGAMYTTDIMRSLKSANLIVVEGTLYPLLNRMRRSGLLEYEWQESSSGPPRKYYRLTADGRAMSGQLTETWQNLNDTIHLLEK